jgi:hypothetical protein
MISSKQKKMNIAQAGVGGHELVHLEPFVVHYAETFIVPAAVGSCTIRPAADRPAVDFATMKAFVRAGA